MEASARLDEWQARLEAALSSMEAGPDELINLREQLLRPDGLPSIFNQLSRLKLEERRRLGAQANALKERLTRAVMEAGAASLNGPALSEIEWDQPGLTLDAGSLHPASLIMERVESLLSAYGFEILCGPEVVQSEENFSQNNIAARASIRESNQSFYIDEQRLLRSHASGIITGELRHRRPPQRLFTIARVHRPDGRDAAHLESFHQAELIVIERGVNLRHVKTLMTILMEAIFQRRLPLEFWQAHFP